MVDVDTIDINTVDFGALQWPWALSDFERDVLVNRLPITSNTLKDATARHKHYMYARTVDLVKLPTMKKYKNLAWTIMKKALDSYYGRMTNIDDVRLALRVVFPDVVKLHDAAFSLNLKNKMIAGEVLRLGAELSKNCDDVNALHIEQEGNVGMLKALTYGSG